MSKRVRFLVAVLMLLPLVLSACGAGEEATEPPAAQAETTTQETEAEPTAEEEAEPPAATVEIEYWYGLGGKLGETVEDMIKRFNESQSEVHVTGVVLPDYATTSQKLQAAVAAGKPPAAVMLTSDSGREFMLAGVLQPLNDLIAANPGFNVEDYPEAYRSPVEQDGKLYGVPIMATTQVLYYRKDFFEELGIDPELLNTWEGLVEAATKCRVVDANGEVTRWGWEPMWGSGNMADAAYSNGARILSEDGKTVLVDQPEWVEVWEAFRKWIHEDKIMRIHYGGEGWAYWYDTIDDVMEGRACGYTGSAGDQGDLDFNIIAAHVQPYWSKWGNLDAMASAHVGSIPAGNSPEVQAAAFKWLSYYTGPEMTAEWSVRTGYMPARKSAVDAPALKEYAVDHPQILVPPTQGAEAQAFTDPTGGKIWDALGIAADLVEIEGKSAAEALAQAQKEAQAALDEALGE